ncbi:MAG: sulfotransferase domain-containing protein [Terriglobales bacterium]
MSSIMKHFVATYRRALGLNRPGRSLIIFDDDVFLVSFPKSGNTWTRFLLANLRFPNEPATWATINRQIPDPSATLRRDFERMPRPRIIKSHECFDPRYPRVINIVRDPRDVVVSQYHYHRKIRRIEDDSPIEKFVTRFLNGETCPHGSWGQNVATWLYTSEGSPRYLQLRYEDLIADAPREMAKVASFLNLPTSPELIAQAVERSSADRMRQLEKQQQHGLYKNSRQDMTFVRKAGSGGWQKDLPTDQVARIENAWGPLMHHLGYQLATQSPSEVGEYAALGTATNVPR